MTHNRIPQRAIPKCDCGADYAIIQREYGTGIHLWLACNGCKTTGFEAVSKRALTTQQRKKLTILFTDNSNMTL